MTINLEVKEIQLEDVCGGDKCLPLKDTFLGLAWVLGGTAGLLQMPRLSRWGRWGPGCQERDRDGPLLLEVGPLHGANEDSLR